MYRLCDGMYWRGKKAARIARRGIAPRAGRIASGGAIARAHEARKSSIYVALCVDVEDLDGVRGSANGEDLGGMEVEACEAAVEENTVVCGAWFEGGREVGGEGGGAQGGRGGGTAEFADAEQAQGGSGGEWGGAGGGGGGVGSARGGNPYARRTLGLRGVAEGDAVSRGAGGTGMGHEEIVEKRGA